MVKINSNDGNNNASLPIMLLIACGPLDLPYCIRSHPQCRGKLLMLGHGISDAEAVDTECNVAGCRISTVVAAARLESTASAGSTAAFFSTSAAASGRVVAHSRCCAGGRFLLISACRIALIKCLFGGAVNVLQHPHIAFRIKNRHWLGRFSSGEFTTSLPNRHPRMTSDLDGIAAFET